MTKTSSRRSRSARSPMRLVAPEETTPAQARPDVHAALESLADLPDDEWFAFERLPDGTLAWISVAEVRRELTDGTCSVNVAEIPVAAALLRHLVKATLANLMRGA